jgi:predicted anti-sigma-YlaC factor YlaD
MRCDEAAEALLDAHDAQTRSAELLAHLAQCPACRALEQRGLGLAHLLSLDVPAEVPASFDARFFARLADEKRAARRSRLWRMSWALVPVAAGLAFALVQATRLEQTSSNEVAQSAVLPPDDVDLAVDLELAENLDVVQKLDEVEDFDLLNEVDDQDLQRIIDEVRR